MLRQSKCLRMVLLCDAWLCYGRGPGSGGIIPIVSFEATGNSGSIMLSASVTHLCRALPGTAQHGDARGNQKRFSSVHLAETWGNSHKAGNSVKRSIIFGVLLGEQVFCSPGLTRGLVWVPTGPSIYCFVLFVKAAKRDGVVVKQRMSRDEKTQTLCLPPSRQNNPVYLWFINPRMRYVGPPRRTFHEPEKGAVSPWMTGLQGYC